MNIHLPEYIWNNLRFVVSGNADSARTIARMVTPAWKGKGVENVKLVGVFKLTLVPSTSERKVEFVPHFIGLYALATIGARRRANALCMAMQAYVDNHKGNTSAVSLMDRFFGALMVGALNE